MRNIRCNMSSHSTRHVRMGLSRIRAVAGNIGYICRTIRVHGDSTAQSLAFDVLVAQHNRRRAAMHVPTPATVAVVSAGRVAEAITVVAANPVDVSVVVSSAV